MSTVPGVEKVCTALMGAGYERAAGPLQVGGVEFDFPAVLSKGLDLVIVVNTVEQPESDLVREAQALVEALDVVGSRRALTLIVFGPRPAPRNMAALVTICRVLPVGIVTRAEQKVLSERLAVFMPLVLPTPSALSRDPLTDLSQKYSNDEKQLVARLLAAAAQSKQTVEREFRAMLEEAFDDAEEG